MTLDYSFMLKCFTLRRSTSFQLNYLPRNAISYSYQVMSNAFLNLGQNWRIPFLITVLTPTRLKIPNSMTTPLSCDVSIIFSHISQVKLTCTASYLLNVQRSIFLNQSFSSFLEYKIPIHDFVSEHSKERLVDSFMIFVCDISEEISTGTFVVRHTFLNVLVRCI